MWWDFGPGPFMFGPLMMLVFFGLCIFVMFFVMRGMCWHRHDGGGALKTLKDRFARGEINQAEYEDRKRVLEAR